MTNKGEVYFALYGDNFDPDEVTHLIGIEPTSVKRKEFPYPKHTSWKFSSGKIEHDFINIYEMSSKLTLALQPTSKQITHVKQAFNLEAKLQVVLWITRNEEVSTPAVGFDQNCISFLNKIGAYIDIDIYKN